MENEEVLKIVQDEKEQSHTRTKEESNEYEYSDYTVTYFYKLLFHIKYEPSFR